MTDLQAELERFETLAAECELITKPATDGSKRELYLRLAMHYRELAADFRKAAATIKPPPSDGVCPRNGVARSA
jgi:hypothetical protein